MRVRGRLSIGSQEHRSRFLGEATARRRSEPQQSPQPLLIQHSAPVAKALGSPSLLPARHLAALQVLAEDPADATVGVAARSAIGGVLTGAAAADQTILAMVAPEDVRARATIELVIPVVADQLVAATATPE